MIYCQFACVIPSRSTWGNRLSDGAEAGVLEPEETGSGNQNTDWMDVMTGIAAQRRKDGEDLVFVEDDYQAEGLAVSLATVRMTLVTRLTLVAGCGVSGASSCRN